jgi:polar amino acid transport system substrate-binding protein
LLNLFFQRLTRFAQAHTPEQIGFWLLILLTASLIGLLNPHPSLARTGLSAIQSRGKLIVGVKENLPPLGFRDSQNQLQGLEIEIARQLAVELLGDASAVEFKPLLNQDRLQALFDGEVDLLVARLTTTDARLRLVDFSDPYYVDGAAFLTRADQSDLRLGDLQPQTVAVLNGSDTISTVRALLPQVQLRGVDSYQAGESLLASGAVTAFAADASLLTGLAQENPGYRLLPTLISAEPLAIATPKGKQQQDLRQQVSQAVKRWRTNGWLAQQIGRWGLPIEGLPRSY